MNQMKNIILIFACIGFLFSNVALSQEADLNKKHGIPVVDAKTLGIVGNGFLEVVKACR